ncbi:hypothetical protein ACAW74_27565 [Fibrella sp. WM1]|uniref:hypothetical protein n=1 Tax=Fibrella musci TaxID=3242485 RepID=UPI0035226442
MKTPLYTRIFCCLMALWVLMGSVGVGMVEHWCQMRGHSKTLLMAQEGCKKACTLDDAPRPVSEGSGVKRMPCCKTTLTYEHLDVSRFVVDGHAVSAPQPAEFISNPEFRLLLAALLPTAPTEPIRPDSQSPLPRTGRFRLASNCTWLI